MTTKLSFSNWFLIFLALLALIFAIELYLFSHREQTPVSSDPKIDVLRSKDKEQPQIAVTQDIPNEYRKPFVAQSCPKGQFVTGIDAEGKIICLEFDTPGFSESIREQSCYGHGILEDGFCTCDDNWAGAHCEKPKKPKSEDAPPDNDFDNVPAPLDCDDNDDLVYPGAPDAVDGKDNDCDGEIDEGY